MPVPTIPERRPGGSLSDCLEVMTRAVFQAGVSWAMIARRWDGFRAAFAEFDVERVAGFGDADVERLAADERILRSPQKIRATMKNARALLALERQEGGFRAYLRSFENYDALCADIRKRFAFMGPMNVWYFLFCVGEDVPRFEDWIPTITGDHPRMREMVAKARAEGTYPA